MARPDPHTASRPRPAPCQCCTCHGGQAAGRGACCQHQVGTDPQRAPPAPQRGVPGAQRPSPHCSRASEVVQSWHQHRHQWDTEPSATPRRGLSPTPSSSSSFTKQEGVPTPTPLATSRDSHHASRQVASVSARAPVRPWLSLCRGLRRSRRDGFHSGVNLGVTVPVAPRRAAASRALTPTRANSVGSALTLLWHAAPPSTGTAQPWAAAGKARGRSPGHAVPPSSLATSKMLR